MTHILEPLPTALITGASRGLGASIALELAAAGHPVAVTYARSRDAAHAVVQAITEAGGRAAPYPTDVTDPAAVTRLVDDVASDLGPVGVLVLNATGPQPEVDASALEIEDVHAQLAYFVDSPVLLLRAVLPAMRAAGCGRVVHIGSDVVQRAPHGNSAYVAAKAAQLGLARVWAGELAPWGITVNTVAPGWVPVERHGQADPEALANYLATVPAGRLGQPGDIAGAVRYLASSGAGFVTGAWLAVNGGATTS